MSLTKLLKAPIKLFRKDVISFLIIRRHDLGYFDDKLTYIAVKPNASISVLRHKVWHLLDLPDFCEEIIILKSNDEKEMSLIELKKGNNPHHPFVLEVWPPGFRQNFNSLAVQSSPRHNMLTLGNIQNNTTAEKTENIVHNNTDCNTTFAITNDTIKSNVTRYPENKYLHLLSTDYKKSETTCRMSSTSLFKLGGRKSRDSFTNILLKIQNDLCTLSNKLSSLENRIPS